MDADDGVGFVVEGETGSSKMQHGVNRPLWGETDILILTQLPMPGQVKQKHLGRA